MARNNIEIVEKDNFSRNSFNFITIICTLIG